MRLINFSKKGVSLVEALVGLAILGITGAAIVSLIVQTMSLSNSNRLRNQAILYAQQGVEQARSFDQTYGWGVLAAKGNSSGVCYSDGTLVTTTTCLIACGSAAGSAIANPVYPADFRQSVKVTTASDQVSVISSVCWQEKSVWYKEDVDTYFYNY